MIFGNTLFFKGCTIRYFLKDVGERYKRILRKIGQDFIEIGEICCGFPLLSAGALGEFDTQGSRIKKILKEYWIKKVISPCPACVCVFKEIGVKSEHVVETFHEYFKKKKPKKKIKKRVYLHYPCHLVRYLDLKEKFLELARVIFEDVVDPKEKKCCGGGGGLRTNFPEISKEIAKKRIFEAKKHEIDAVVTCCPLCYIQLKEVGEIKVMELSEAIEEIL